MSEISNTENNEEIKWQDIKDFPITISNELPVWLEGQPHDPITLDLSAYEGVRYHLFEKHILVEEDKIIFFMRTIRQAVSMNGVEECAKIFIEFNPQWDQIIIHNLFVYQGGGEKKDWLAHTSLNVLKREYHAESNIFSGEVSLSMLLNNLKINDYIELSYSIVVTDKLNAKFFSAEQQLQYGVRIGHLIFSLYVPINLKIQSQSSGNKYSFSIETSKDKKNNIYSIKLKDVPECAVPRYLPHWYRAFDSIQLGLAYTWRDIALHHAKFYPKIQITDGQLANVITQIANQPLDDQGKALAALDYINLNIRYLSYYRATDAFIPTRPDITVSRLYGDCKDLAYLFLCMLWQLGIDASPVLVHTRNGKNLKNELPGFYLFNHVMVVLDIANTQYFIDATIRQQVGKLCNCLIPDYGLGLICDERKPGIIEIASNGIKDSLDVYDEYQVSPNTKEVTFKTKNVLKGWPAFRLINTLMNYPEQDFINSINNFYNKLLDDRTVVEFNINKDLINENEISYEVIYQGTLKGMKIDKKSTEVPVIFIDIYYQFDSSLPPSLDHDFYFGGDLRIDYEIQILRQGIDFSFATTDFNIANQAFNLAIHSKGEFNKWQSNATYERKETLISKDDYESFRESLLEAEKQCVRVVWFKDKTWFTKLLGWWSTKPLFWWIGLFSGFYLFLKVIMNSF